VTIRCVVPATDAPGSLERCLQAIRESTGPPEELVCVTEPFGSGPAAARNAGAAGGDCDLLVFVDADVLVHPDAFARIREAFEEDPGLAAVFGAYDDSPEAPDAVSGFRNLLHHRVHLESAGPAQTFWAGLGAVRRDAFEAAAGFRAERFERPSVEDIDLGMRLSAAGHRIRLDPQIQGKHLKRWTLAEMVRVDFSRRGVPWTELVLESDRRGRPLNLAPRQLAATLASLIVVGGILARRPRTAALGLVAALALNADLYRLIWRRRGPWQATAALVLHPIHHLTATAAGAVGLVRHLFGARVASSRSRAGSGWLPSACSPPAEHSWRR
jgi:Glycosyl transferase family group 2